LLYQLSYLGAPARGAYRRNAAILSSRTFRFQSKTMTPRALEVDLLSQVEVGEDREVDVGAHRAIIGSADHFLGVP
jgi:hypothetical protein